MAETHASYPLSYKGSYLWLIPSLLFWPPLGICLLIRGLRLTINHQIYFVHYKGNYFWLVFWALFFPPIAVILGALNGFDVKIEYR